MMQKLVVSVLVVVVLAAMAVGLFDVAPVHAGTVLPSASGLPQQGPTATPAPGTGPILRQQAINQVGEPWTASGTITALGISGFTLELSDGTQIFVEMGPAYYWTAQGVTLAAGDIVTVDGFYNGVQYHAATVTTADGAVLTVRTDTGLPLWSGSTSRNGQAGAGQAARGQGQGGQGSSRGYRGGR